MDKKFISLILSFVVFTRIMMGVVAPRADKLKAKSKLEKYFELQDITMEEIESIEYYTSGFFSFGVHSNGAYVVYKNEPDCVYHYSYLMTGDSVYPNIEIIRNGEKLKTEEYTKLKNKTVSYDEFNKYFVF